MSVRPAEILELAFRLLEASKNSRNREAEIRAAISRAYYGAFLAAREYANITSKHGPHKAVLEHFNGLSSKEIFYLLESLKFNRLQADYDIHIDIEDKIAISSCKKSKNIINLIEKLEENKMND